MERGMSGKQRIALLCAAGGTVVILAVVLTATLPRTKTVSTVTGAVLRGDPDPREQLPIADAAITVAHGLAPGSFHSDGSGRFTIHFPEAIPAGEMITLKFRHPDYQPIDVTERAGDLLYVVRMTPNETGGRAASQKPPVTISDVRVRYAAKVTTTANIGSTVRTFQVVNTGNVPCSGSSTCSPDGRWKASVGGLSLDAGDGNAFRNTRVSCIAGPCAFTRITNDAFSQGGRVISVSVLNWSDTTTFLIEAEVVRTMPTETVRHLYPVIFGRSMNFTLPPSGQGPSIEAEVNGESIVFPLGPKLILSWANCQLEVAPDFTKMYRCDLKDGYQFH
jgi:hypothetical protein